MKRKNLRLKTAFRAVMLILMLGSFSITNTNAQSNHDYVDLGLPSGTLWATCNIGANAPEEYGDYFWLSHNDFATDYWGTDWCTPTYNEWVELYQNTTCTWATLNGVHGRLFSAINGNSLFLPCAGYYDSEYDLWGTGYEGYYWSRSTATYNPYTRWCYHTYGYSYTNNNLMEHGYSNFDIPVRPVRFQNTPYPINVTMNPAGGGVVTGTGSYAVGETCTLTITANDGYLFENLTINNEIVSTEPVYSFTVNEGAVYVANFISVSNIIDFADANVKSICVSHWDTNGDGEISIAEALAVTDLGTGFSSSSISSFNELYYFQGLTSIGKWAFYNSGLTSVIIPKSVTTIDECAFQGCSNLTSIKIPSSVKEIKNYVFQYCTNLASINITDNISFIGAGAFDDTRWLDYQSDGIIYLGNWCIGYKGTKPSGTLTIEDGTLGIASDAFAFCTGITSVSLPSTLKYINTAVFHECSNITSITMPNSILYIGHQAFFGCSKLGSINLGNSLTYIGQFAFYNCTSLNTITIPNTVTTIEDVAFENCTGLTSMMVLATTPPTIKSFTFRDVSKTIPVYVPHGSVDDYNDASYWSEFTNIIESPYIFNETGLWTNTANWIPNELPGTTSDVLIRASTTVNVDVAIHSLTLDKGKTLVINSGITLTVTGTITESSSGSIIIIEDGGQLVNTTSGITARVKKNIIPWTTSPDNGWHAISTPVDNVAFTNVSYLTNTSYNVYRLNETTMTWENSQHSGNTFSSFDNGRGNLYRKGSSWTTDIQFRGTLNTASVNYPLSYTTTGFHLIGNPYPHNIYKGTNAAIPNTYLEDGFYTLTSAGGWVAGTDNTTAIAPCQAVLVQAKSSVTDEDLVITKTTATGPTKSNDDNIMFVVSNSNYEDVAYALFKDGHGLNKIDHRNADIQKLYIQHNGEDFAIVNLAEDVQAFNLNFHATTTGKYTLNVKADGNFSYLHLIDNLTGADIDLLLENVYSFIGASSDKDNRFIVKLKYASTANDDEVFAYQNGNEIVVNGEGNLQIYDVLGRYIMNREINGVETVDVSSLQTGVYILRMTGNSIKTQKIVVK